MSSTPSIDQFPPISYTDRDYETILAALTENIRRRFPNDWKDFRDSATGVAFMQMVAWCFSGDTLVSLCDGTEVSLEDLAQRDDSFWVYGYDLEDGRVKASLATAKLTHESALLLEVELDDGSRIRATPLHLWLMRDGSFKMTQDLEPGDSLMPLYRRYDVGSLRGYEKFRCPTHANNRWVWTHRAFAGPCPGEKELVHHEDFDKRNNSPDNLGWETRADHMQIHDHGAEVLRRLHHTPGHAERARENIKKAQDKLRSDSGAKAAWREALKPSWEARRKKFNGPSEVDACPHCGRALETHAAYVGHVGKCLQNPDRREEKVCRPKSEETRRKISAAHRGKKLSAAHKEAIGKSQRGKKVSPETRRKMSEAAKWRWARERGAVESNNHRVVAVSLVSGLHQTYDLVMDQFHIFALSAGVFVHNSFDNLSYYLDVRANEAFLPTAKDRISIINLGKLVGYKLSPASSASLLVTATIETAKSKDTILSSGISFLTKSGVPFEFLTEGRIPAGALSAQITVTQGESESDTFTSDGSAFQSFQLTTSQVLDNTVEVRINTVLWSEVDSLVFSDENSTAFAVDRDENDFATIKFGDGVSGFIPPAGASIAVSYRVGGGVQGNIALNEVDTTVTGFLEAVEPPEAVKVTLSNSTERGSGGEDRETIDHAKFYMPRSVATNGRAVTTQDFDTLASLFNDATFGSPSAAAARLKQEIPELNTVELFVWSRDSTGAISDEPGSGLLNAMQEYFDENGAGAVRIVSVDTEVKAGTNVYVDVTARVRASSAYAPAQVTANARQAIGDYFDSPNLVRPGEDVRLSQLYDRIMGAQGVEYAIISRIAATLRVTETFSVVGDGTTAVFTHTTDELPVAGSVLIEAASVVVTDDSSGNLRGSVDPTGVNSVNYETGAITVTFATAPAMGVVITVRYRYITTYQRGELEMTADGVSGRFTGSLDFPPAKILSVAITDGTQVVVDDGDGNLVGDVYASGIIDYDTGYYDFTFAVIPAAGSEIRTTYVQVLSTDSQDLPISKDQLAVESITTVSSILGDTTN